MTHTKIILVYLTLVLCLTACHKTAPQRPTRLHEERPVDEQTLAVIRLNEQMVAAADKSVAERVQQLPAVWAQHENGMWVERPTASSSAANRLERDEHVQVHLVIRTLTGDMLLDSEREMIVGHCREINAVEEILPEMTRHDYRHLIAPWYTAYGAVGYEDKIKGYENIEIELWTIE